MGTTPPITTNNPQNTRSTKPDQTKPKGRKNRNGHYRSNFVTSQGVGVSVGGTIAHVSCVIKSPEEMFIESEYARLVAKGYISEDE